MRLAHLSWALMFGVLLPIPAWALSLTLSPVTVEVAVAPGETSSFKLRLVNNEELATRVRGYAWDYWHEDGQRFSAPPGTTPRSAAAWVRVVPKTAEIPGGGEVQFDGTVSAPHDATGGYYSMVFLQTAPAEYEVGAGATATASGRIGARVFVRIEGTGTEALTLNDSEFVPPTPTRPAEIHLSGRNTGDLHVRARFKGVVRTTDGEVIASVSSGDPVWVLPGETYALSLRWSEPMEPGAYELAGVLTYGDGKVLPGVFPLIIEPPDDTRDGENR